MHAGSLGTIWRLSLATTFRGQLSSLPLLAPQEVGGSKDNNHPVETPEGVEHSRMLGLTVWDKLGKFLTEGKEITWKAEILPQAYYLRGKLECVCTLRRNQWVRKEWRQKTKDTWERRLRVRLQEWPKGIGWKIQTTESRRVCFWARMGRSEWVGAEVWRGQAESTWFGWSHSLKAKSLWQWIFKGIFTLHILESAIMLLKKATPVMRALWENKVRNLNTQRHPSVRKGSRTCWVIGIQKKRNRNVGQRWESRQSSSRQPVAPGCGLLLMPNLPGREEARTVPTKPWWKARSAHLIFFMCL